jgi:hypothetical protein
MVIICIVHINKSVVDEKYLRRDFFLHFSQKPGQNFPFAGPIDEGKASPPPYDGPMGSGYFSSWVARCFVVVSTGSREKVVVF